MLYISYQRYPLLLIIIVRHFSSSKTQLPQTNSVDFLERKVFHTCPFILTYSAMIWTHVAHLYLLVQYPVPESLFSYCEILGVNTVSVRILCIPVQKQYISTIHINSNKFLWFFKKENIPHMPIYIYFFFWTDILIINKYYVQYNYMTPWARSNCL